MDVGLAVPEANMLGFKISPGWQTLCKCGGNGFSEIRTLRPGRHWSFLNWLNSEVCGV